MDTPHSPRPHRPTFAELARKALEKHVPATRAEGVEWTLKPNLAWVRWRWSDGRWFGLALRRHLDWMTGEAALSITDRPLEEVPLGTPEELGAGADDGFRVRLGQILNQGDTWWSGEGDPRKFHERLEWLALQLHVKAQHWMEQRLQRS